MLGERIDTHPMVLAVIKEMLVAEAEGRTTKRQAKNIVLSSVEVYVTAFEVFLESEARTATSIDFGGDVQLLNRFRDALLKVRDRVRDWKAKQKRAIEEGA